MTTPQQPPSSPPNVPPRQVFARPDVFEVKSMQQAMNIILTPEAGTTTAERWEKETKYLVPDIGKRLKLSADTCILDYGCGIGRMAKGLIDAYGCRVIGVDFSDSMRLLAPDYVLSDRFIVWSPGTLDKMLAKGFAVDAAISLWVIQHVFQPMEVIQRISNAIRPGGLLYALNQNVRCVPTNVGWVNDGFDLRGGLCKVFKEISMHSLPTDATTPQLAAISMIQLLQKPAAA